MGSNNHLSAWWTDHARDEAACTIPKMVEYGSGDLTSIGYTVADIAGMAIDNDTHAMEIGVLFYALGKIQRAVAAAKRGVPASDDTWFDLAVYAKMVQAARAGVWPGNTAGADK